MRRSHRLGLALGVQNIFVWHFREGWPCPAARAPRDTGRRQWSEFHHFLSDAMLRLWNNSIAQMLSPSVFRFDNQLPFSIDPRTESRILFPSFLPVSKSG